MEVATMAILVKTVKINGSGDYTDLASGVADILSSGLAATGYYTEYVLNVDNGEYSGYFEATVPYSGLLKINGSGTWFVPSQASVISGESFLNSPNVEISDLSINATNATEVFNVYNGTTFKLKDLEILNATNGIINSGVLELENVSAHGIGYTSGGCFLKDYGATLVHNSKIAFFVSGIYSSDLTVYNSVIHNNSYNVVGYSGILNLSEVLIYGGGSGIVMEVVPTGYIYIEKSTIDSPIPIYISGCIVQVGDSILYGDTYCIHGSLISGLVEDSIMYPSGTPLTITSTNTSNLDPQFKNRTIGDYRLKFIQTIGSPAVEFKDNGLFSSGVEIYTEQGQFYISDARGGIRATEFRNFVYRQGNTLLLSDYGKEIDFANMIYPYSDLSFSVEMIANFSVSGVPVNPSFSAANTNAFPYDWDYTYFETAEITDRHKYLIPRSVVDVASVISGYIGNVSDSVIFSKMDKTSIRAYLFKDYRGVSFDYDLSTASQPILWVLEGQNQILSQTNAFTGEHYADYPLFVPNLSGKPIVLPSGMIFVGVHKDQYRFILESNPNIEILADNRDGYLNWIATDIDTHKDARGVLAYKGNLFITATEYSPQSIFDRTTIPIYSGSNGKLLLYDNNNTFEHYIANYTTQLGPSGFLLDSGNCYPTDLTVYEDGRLLIADWNEHDKLFKYKLAYDYAIVQSSYDTETRILLREYYDNVEL
jgi:hypothetical protein